MNQNPHNRRSDGAYYPESPVIGRFVSPWDTSGWYSVFAEFDVGAKLHSNEEVTASSVPERLRGADYIMTFNSRADGFDDKQEVDFFCERDAIVSVAIDARLSLALPSFIAEFTATGESLLASDGREYLFSKGPIRRVHMYIFPAFAATATILSYWRALPPSKKKSACRRHRCLALGRRPIKRERIAATWWKCSTTRTPCRVFPAAAANLPKETEIRVTALSVCRAKPLSKKSLPPFPPVSF